MNKYLLPVLLLLFASCEESGCSAWQQVANSIKDTDGDGWMDEASNQRTDLFIEEVDLSSATTFSLIVDDQILLSDANSLPSSTLATSRYAGQWHVGNQLAYAAQVKLFLNNDTETAQVREFPFHNRDSTYEIAFNLGSTSVAVQYRSSVSTFADPSPTDAEADEDDDGITDQEEAILAQNNSRLGDPSKKDILVCIGYTAPKWALLKKSIERITTVFAGQEYNLLMADEASDLPGLTPGQILFTNASGALIIPTENRGVRLGEVPPIRPRHIAEDLNPFTHMLVAAENTNTPNADFGIASFPGNNLVIRSHLYLLGPEPLGFEYQAIDAMHELGHNFGLCHPNQSDSTCLTGPIPLAERNGAASCMGSPADDGGLMVGILPNVAAITNAFNRPLDYSPAQWSNMDVSLSRRE